MQITPRQSFILRKVVEGHQELGNPVGSKWLAELDDVPWGPSTVRAEFARLEEAGMLAHPHTSAGRVPTDTGYRLYVDELLEEGELPAIRKPLELTDVRRELEDAMRATTEQLSQVTDLLALVSAPPIETATIHRVEVLPLQPQVAMVVVITSTGGVTKRLISYDRPLDSGLVEWAGSYLNEALGGMDVGARMLAAKLTDPELGSGERAFLETLTPAFTDLEDTAGDTLFVDGAARLLTEDRFQELTQLSDLHERAGAAGGPALGAARVARRALRLPAHRARERRSRAALAVDGGGQLRRRPAQPGRRRRARPAAHGLPERGLRRAPGGQ